MDFHKAKCTVGLFLCQLLQWSLNEVLAIWNTGGPEGADAHRLVHKAVVDEPVSCKEPAVAAEGTCKALRVHFWKFFEMAGFLENEIALPFGQFFECVQNGLGPYDLRHQAFFLASRFLTSACV